MANEIVDELKKFPIAKIGDDWKKLNTPGKIAVVGSIASIFALFLVIAKKKSTTTTATTAKPSTNIPLPFTPKSATDAFNPLPFSSPFFSTNPIASNGVTYASGFNTPVTSSNPVTSFVSPAPPNPITAALSQAAGTLRSSIPNTPSYNVASSFYAPVYNNPASQAPTPTANPAAVKSTGVLGAIAGIGSAVKSALSSPAFQQQAQAAQAAQQAAQSARSLQQGRDLQAANAARAAQQAQLAAQQAARNKPVPRTQAVATSGFLGAISQAIPTFSQPVPIPAAQQNNTVQYRNSRSTAS